MPKGRENVYVCPVCGGYTVTIDLDEGVTPFMLGCRASGAPGHCTGMARSSFYPEGPRPPFIPAPAWEWYRQTEQAARRLDRQYPGSYQHWKQGGLHLRKRMAERAGVPPTQREGHTP